MALHQGIFKNNVSEITTVPNRQTNTNQKMTILHQETIILHQFYAHSKCNKIADAFLQHCTPVLSYTKVVNKYGLFQPCYSYMYKETFLGRK